MQIDQIDLEPTEDGEHVAGYVYGTEGEEYVFTLPIDDPERTGAEWRWCFAVLAHVAAGLVA